MRSFNINKILFWLPMPVIGTLNGLFRGLVLMRFMSEFHAKQVSSLMLIVLLFLYTAIIYDRLRIRTTKEAFATGLIWLLLTIAFEFLLGYVVLQHNIITMLEEYNILKGNLWSLVLIAILFIPYLHIRINTIGTRKMSNT